jgi:DNA-binding NarL/FixJ family response regulator
MTLRRYAEAMTADATFAAVIMDLTVPNGMGRREAAQRILEQAPDARLIMASGYSDDPV